MEPRGVIETCATDWCRAQVVVAACIFFAVDGSGSWHLAAPKKSLDALFAGAQMKAAHSEMHGPFPVLDICASTGLSLCCKRSGSRNQAECGQCEARQYIELGSSCTSAVGGCPLNAVKTTAHKSSPVYMQ